MKTKEKVINKTAEIKSDGNDVVVVSNGKEVFRIHKTRETVSIANSIFFYYRYPEQEGKAE